MFDERGDICKAVTFSDLAHHIFFTETGEPLPKPVNGRKPLIGVCRGTAYYLLWDRQNGGHILNPAEARRLPAHDGTKVVFADGCVLSAERRRRLGIVFKQIPYAIRKR
jgi:site-specific DNA-methyltransferase (adenine-specific)/adenine-specific DNA-methyltransferase